MNKIIEDLLWSIYFQTEQYRIGGRGDARFILLNDIIKDIHGFTGKQLKTVVFDLNRQKLIEKKKDYENSVLVSLTERGMLRVLNFRFRRLNDKKEKWDRKWRMVAFDIPDSHRKGRNALRYRLKMGGFYELPIYGLPRKTSRMKLTRKILLIVFMKCPSTLLRSAG